MRAKRVTALIATAIVSFEISQTASASDLPAETTAATRDESHVFRPGWNLRERGDHSLEFRGYYRYGYGWADDGEAMPSFHAPGAPAKYRLGNEDVQGGEIVIDYRYYLDGLRNESRNNETGSRFVQLQGRWEEFQHIRDIEELFLEFNSDSMTEAFIRLGNVIADGTHVWFGRRFYDRRDIHLLDHFWLNVAQGSNYGGGIEGIRLGHDKTLDIAVLYAYDEGARYDPVDPTDDTIDSYIVDARLRGYSVGPDSELTIVGQAGYRPGYQAPKGVTLSGLDAENQYGFGLGAYYERKTTAGGHNKTGVMYRQGAALVQSDFNSRAPTELQGYDLDEAWSLEANNDLLVEMAPRWSLQWATVARYEDTGHPGFDEDATGESILWLSTGIRPIFYIKPKINVAWESGLDYVDNERVGAKGALWKNTVALQFQKRPGYFERPVLRLFVTHAKWSDDLRGTIAASSKFINDTSGFVFGVQVEAAW